ncbi:hypothetical protein NKJ89_07585 [Mesorhizobium sp. M0047]
MTGRVSKESERFVGKYTLYPTRLARFLGSQLSAHHRNFAGGWPPLSFDYRETDLIPGYRKGEGVRKGREVEENPLVALEANEPVAFGDVHPVDRACADRPDSLQ